MTAQQRIQKGQELYTPNGSGYDLSPTGVLILLAETLHTTKGLPPDSQHVLVASNLMLQRVADQARRNGCPDTARWLDQLTAPSVADRRIAGDELVSWLTFTEFQSAVRSIKP